MNEKTCEKGRMKQDFVLRYPSFLCVCGVRVFVMRGNGCDQAKKGTLRHSLKIRKSSVMSCPMWFNQHRDRKQTRRRTIYSPHLHGRRECQETQKDRQRERQRGGKEGSSQSERGRIFGLDVFYQ